MKLIPPRKHYQWYYTTPNANAELLDSKQGLKDFFRAYYHMKSGDWLKNKPFELKHWNAKELEKLPHYYIMEASKTMAETVAEEMPTRSQIENCKWLTEEELKVYVNEYQKTGFQGGLNCYWNNTHPEFLAEFQLFKSLQIVVPTCFIAGSKDWGIFQVPGAITKMQRTVCNN